MDKALADAAGKLDLSQEAALRVLNDLWDAAFQQGRIDALDELQDRFCVCMK